MKVIASILMLLLSASAAAQVNRCVDAAGKVVAYGSGCPAGTRAEQTNIRNAPGASASPQKGLAERDADFRKRQIEQQEASAKAEKKNADLAQRKRACEEGRAYLKALQERHRVTRTDPKTGERVYLSDNEYPAQIAKAQRAVSESCS